MASALNAGFVNNINIIQIRTNGANMFRVTDRSIDINGDGVKERVTVALVSGGSPGTPSAPGGVAKETFTVPAGFNHTVVRTIFETDGGVTRDTDVAQFTTGF